MNSILAAIDFSKPSLSALREAARLAAAQGARLKVVHILSPESIEDVQELRPIPTDRILANAQAQLDALVSGLPGLDTPAQAEVLIGYPYDALVEAADESKADLVVIGTRGQTDEPHAVGMVASRFVRRAPSPVLLVRERHEQPFRRVVACIDFSKTSAKALELAADIARLESAALDIVHAYYAPWSHPTAVLYNLTQNVREDEKQKYLTLLEERLDRFVTDVAPDLAGLTVQRVLLDSPKPAYAIINHLKAVGADLAVLGTRGRTGLRSLLLGTTAERLIHESPCSVLTTKPSAT